MYTFIIDDDYLSSFITEQMLVIEGFSNQIRSFLSAEAALALIMQDYPANVPDVIFLDLNMPQMNGWEFLDALAPFKNEIKEKCRIYILTSSLLLKDSQKSKDYELVNGFIPKPLDNAYIQTILAEIKNEL